MTLKSARQWIAIYFLLVTSFVGGYLLLFARTKYLPIDKDHSSAAFQILIPVLVGQITVIFQWIAQMTGQHDDDQVCPIPTWAIKLPPLLAFGLISASIVVLVIGNWGEGGSSAMGPEEFKSIFTFAVSILNATTLFLVGRLFPKASASDSLTKSGANQD